MDKGEIPPIDSALLVYLTRTYPNEVPSIEDTEREIFFNAGAVSVVEHLIELYNKQFEKD